MDPRARQLCSKAVHCTHRCQKEAPELVPPIFISRGHSGASEKERAFNEMRGNVSTNKVMEALRNLVKLVDQKAKLPATTPRRRNDVANLAWRALLTAFVVSLHFGTALQTKVESASVLFGGWPKLLHRIFVGTSLAAGMAFL
mmetsp:Transcript_1333/g.5394  ORF Transcript_1333/g.5394 Transcript_1333/m.5394 type:complete len:143 (-) Transcript_1333:332-760(-)